MASSELVPLSEAFATNGGDRRAALGRLAEAAELASTPQEAREVMLKGQALASLLKQAKAPWEEACLAGKASVLAARKLGQLLNDLDSTPRPIGIGQGSGLSERGQVRIELGLTWPAVSHLIRLTEVGDPDFQRYIQRRDLIPTVSGTLVATGRKNRTSGADGTWQARKRKKANVRIPANPSLDEAYSLIVRALGHLSGLDRSGVGPRKLAMRLAIDALYVAEDHLKPYRGGYVK